MLFWESKHDLKRVFGGKKAKFKCGQCGQVTTFHESTIDDNLKIYFVVEVWKHSKRVMQCNECLAVCDFYQLFPDAKSHEEQTEVKRKQEESEAEAKRKKADAAARQKQEELDNKKREQERVRKSKEIDNELEALKKKLGK